MEIRGTIASDKHTCYRVLSYTWQDPLRRLAKLVTISDPS